MASHNQRPGYAASSVSPLKNGRLRTDRWKSGRYLAAPAAIVDPAASGADRRWKRACDREEWRLGERGHPAHCIRHRAGCPLPTPAGSRLKSNCNAVGFPHREVTSKTKTLSGISRPPSARELRFPLRPDGRPMSSPPATEAAPAAEAGGPPSPPVPSPLLAASSKATSPKTTRYSPPRAADAHTCCRNQK
jgi:hypothetical protein